MVSSDYVLRDLVKTHDRSLVPCWCQVPCVLKLITRDMLATMRPGTVLVDVAVDQVVVSKPVNPLRTKILRTSSTMWYTTCGQHARCCALYIYTGTHQCYIAVSIKLASSRLEESLPESMELRNRFKSARQVYKAVADAFNLGYTDVKEVIG